MKNTASFFLRLLFIGGGFLFIGLGTVGIFIPILPTVPFYLLASFCLAKGSKKYEAWFKSTRLYKKRVYFLEKYKTMTLFSQLSVLIFVSCILIATCLFVDNIAVSISLPILSATQYFYFILKIKPVSKKEFLNLKKLDENSRDKD